eukprot:SAG31_NODE_4460_length_3214_cov_1.382665_3_plen_108_part_00
MTTAAEFVAAKVALEDQDWDTALTKLNSLIEGPNELTPTSDLAKWHIFRGLAYYRLVEFMQAIEDFSRYQDLSRHSLLALRDRVQWPHFLICLCYLQCSRDSCRNNS